MVREVLALARSEIQKAGVLLHTALPPDLPPVLADRVQLQQLLLNLILNAIEAMGPVEGRPRELRVGAAHEDGAVRVTVRDSGIGIDRSEVERIFDPFYTTKQDGMGMGLAISRSIAENHGGRLGAEPNPGAGATFTLTLPAGA